MGKTLFFCLGLFFASCLGLSSYAETVTKDFSPKQAESQTLGSSLINAEIQDSTGNRLGKIQEIVINRKTGQIDYAIVSFGGFLDGDDRWFAVPWQAFNPSSELDQKVIYLYLDKEILRNGPSFNKKEWPLDDHQWMRNLYQYYGYKSEWN